MLLLERDQNIFPNFGVIDARSRGFPGPARLPDPALRLTADAFPLPDSSGLLCQRLCAILQRMGAISAEGSLLCAGLLRQQGGGLTDTLVMNALADEDSVLRAWSEWLGIPMSDPALTEQPLDPALPGLLGVEFCLRHRILPMYRQDGADGPVIIATADPEGYDRLRLALDKKLGPIVPVLASARMIEARLLGLSRNDLARRAEQRVRPDESCRSFGVDNNRIYSAGGMLLLGGLAMAPSMIFASLFVVATVVLIVNAGLKLGAGLLAIPAILRAPRAAASGLGETAPPALGDSAAPRLPVVSLVVALYREESILDDLLARLTRLDYPRALLDICLVVEEDDTNTRTLLDAARLPPFMRMITVPGGPIRTKPRALNFALPLCRGSIVGVYDAEDAPAPDQIRRVAAHLSQAPEDVGCVQGVLDFYNPNQNWLARCFAIEYAVWFRVMLPGLARLGLPVPLGGTTVFFRRRVLERLDGWDAHNVTEDADLGVRLARYGYRTEMVPTVTLEEANCRMLPWIRQRSRWIKGYAMTYRVHMRAPRVLWRQLGPRGFLGFQALFLGSLLGFLMAPVLMSFWLAAFGLAHPVALLFPPWAVSGLIGLFIAAECISLGVALLALHLRGFTRLAAWAPTLHFYFPLASVATLKAAYELIAAPFYWDKTRHGTARRNRRDAGILR